jgi:hypothetical protein
MGNMNAKAKLKKMRISIDITLEDHKKITAMAVAEGMSVREFISGCIEEKIYSYPNAITLKAMESARKGQTIRAIDFRNLCNQLGI